MIVWFVILETFPAERALYMPTVRILFQKNIFHAYFYGESSTHMSHCHLSHAVTNLVQTSCI